MDEIPLQLASLNRDGSAYCPLENVQGLGPMGVKRDGKQVMSCCRNQSNEERLSYYFVYFLVRVTRYSTLPGPL